MAQIIEADKDTITGIKLTAFRKGQPWPLPADAAVTSSDANVLAASSTGADVVLSRVPGEGAGDVFALATAGGLSATLPVTVQAAGPDNLVFDESGAVSS